MKLQVAGFLDNSLVNGKGFRSVIFVSGCNHNCPGCQNKCMQDFSYGSEVQIEEILDRIKNNKPIIKGVTFSGGEPFENAEGLLELAKDIKKMDLNLWCYTGFTYEEILKSKDEYKIELLKNMDVLVDGKFKEELKENAKKYTGSRNQRVIDVKESLKKNMVVTLD
ncbi:anaerobic ribonucleoside-triphosphate reductase activating protein [Haloimpatiens sp. FM7315]|uniref:anaerobic ribonucleoside-triphosphate reductase activating protein n=1 Tax=Haloimpatiens sp. FM7315 TaxID=3298609 RepID=UPI003709CAEF